MPIFAVKTQVGQEENVLNLLEKASKRSGKIYALLAPKELRGYIFVESEDIDIIKRIVRNMRYAREVLEKEVNIEEIERFLFPPSAVAKIDEGMIVELIGGPFRGEKGKVIRVDDAKEEITVELLDAIVPIPITVRGEQVRILKKKEE